MSNFINKLLSLKNNISFCMPGHNKHNIFNKMNLFILDKTEHIETGNLYENDFPIKYIQKKSAKYYGVKYAYLSTNGATACILTLILTYIGKNGILIVDTNCHKSVINSIALFNIKVFFIKNKIINFFNITENIINFENLLIKLKKKYSEKKIAIIITNPTYYGVILNIDYILKISQKYNIPLIVDQAHAAHFKALNIKNAVQLGALASVISIHKTLPSLTQSAMILTNKKNDTLMYNMSLFSTSSPSYLILSSIDKTISYMKNIGDKQYLNDSYKATILIKLIKSQTIFTPLENHNNILCDPLRLTISCKNTGYSGKYIFETLYTKYKIEAEMFDYYNVVFILAGINRNFDILLQTLKKFKIRKNFIINNNIDNKIKFNHINKIPIIENEIEVQIKYAIGKICSRPYFIYPPGTALILPGQIITKNHIDIIKNLHSNNTKLWIKKEYLNEY